MSIFQTWRDVQAGDGDFDASESEHDAGEESCCFQLCLWTQQSIHHQVIRIIYKLHL